MEDQHALLALAGAGSDEDREEAKEVLYGRYAVPLLSHLERMYVDEDAANSGMADAFMELFEGEAERLLDRDVWRWLMMRASSRAVDHMRRRSRMMKDVPDDLKDSIDLEDVGEVEPVDSSGMDPHSQLVSKETKVSVLEVLGELEEPDRGILLHDLVVRYEFLSTEEAEELDSELISCLEPHGVYSRDALMKRRQRLYKKLDQRGTGGLHG